VSDQLVTVLAIAAFPGAMNGDFDETNRRIQRCREVPGVDVRRMEQVLHARLKHVQEHLQR
jgi:hypothetical protein